MLRRSIKHRESKNRFSLRKMKMGLVSISLGLFILLTPFSAHITQAVSQPGNKTFTITTPVKFTIQYIANDKLDRGKQVTQVEGVDGVETKTVTLTQDSVTNKTVASQPIIQRTKEPVTKIIQVGTKPSTLTQPVDFSTEYQADETLTKGTKSVAVEGKNGAETKTITYTVNSTTGDLIANEPTIKRTVQPVKKIIKVGTKPTTVSTQLIDFPIEYKADSNLERNKTVIETTGQKGEEVKAMTYTVDKDTGNVIDNIVTTTQTKAPVTQVVKVGTKPTSVITPVDFPVEYVADETLERGQQVISRQGQQGLEMKTVSYTVDKNTGKITANPITTTQTKVPVAQVVKVGTKPASLTAPVKFPIQYIADDTLESGKQVISKKGQQGVQMRSVSYIVDKKTGKIGANPAATTQTKAPETQVIRVGTKPTTSTASVGYKTIYKSDDSLEYAKQEVETEGKDGVETTTVTYTLDTQTGKVTPNKPTVVQTSRPVTQVIKVGTKPTMTTTSIDFSVTYKANDTLEKGNQRIDKSGEKGQIIKSVTYTVNELTGEISENQATVINTINPVTQVISVGTKPTVTTKSVDFTTTYKPADTLEYGKQDIESDGKTGMETITTTYTVNAITGEITPDKVTTKRTSDPIAKVIKVGTKPTVTTKSVDFTTTYKPADTLEYGKQDIESDGKTGMETITTTYTVNAITGEITPDKVTTKRTSDPIAKVIKVGTKPTVTTKSVDFTTTYKPADTLEYGKQDIESDGKTGMEIITTTYTVNAITGEITPDKVTTKRTSDPIAKVIKVGTKPTVTTKSVDFATTHKSDNTLEYGQQVVEIDGKNGVETITVTYTLNQVTGEVISNPPIVERVSNPVTKVIRVGTKVATQPMESSKKVDATPKMKKDTVLPKTGDNMQSATSLGILSLLTSITFIMKKCQEEQ